MSDHEKLKKRIKDCEAALEGRLGSSDEAIKWACEEYVATEDALPDCFDVEDYQLHKAVESLVRANERLESENAHLITALKEAKVALEHYRPYHQGSPRIDSALATINKLLGPPTMTKE